MLATLFLFAGCEKDLLENVHDAGADADLPVVDAPVGRCKAPTTDPPPAAQYTLFVNFDGVTLGVCSSPDSRANCSNLIQTDTTFPAFLDGNPARDSFIASILFPVRKALAPYSIDVVTTRPASGNYYMMVVGGTPALIGAPSGVGGIAPASCNPADLRNGVSLIFDRGQAPTTSDYASSILSDMGVFAAIPVTNSPVTDCLCRVNGCDFKGGLCTYGVNSTVNPDPQFNCGLTAVDEPAMLQAVLGCR
ncbi:MAG TPA: hypothetical protein VFV99_03040 [Kofleriaceae bacterium]|nr:hypothetical protein [Kofleriaceae bacterium]